MDYGLELSPNEKKCTYELEKHFDSISIYNGDEELISSVNTEYEFDKDDIFRTDGDINISAHLVHVGNETCSQIILLNDVCFSYTTCIRNATYLIIADRPEGIETWQFHLRIDHPFLESHFQKVLDQLTSMKKDIGHMEYYVDKWRCKGGLIPNSISVSDVFDYI